MSWSIEGKTVLVTGGNSGIGQATATALARAGAHVVFTARDPAKAEAALAGMREAIAGTGSAGGTVDWTLLDLASLSSVRDCAKRFLDEHDALHVLVNNAGLMQSKRHETEDGFETTFGTNHLGPFLLTRLLLDRLVASGPARIVNVSSGAHRSPRRGLDFDDLQNRDHRYRGMKAYGRSKLANIYMTRELARRLEGTGVTANAMHPGWVNTGFSRDGDTRVFDLGMRLVGRFARTPERGADTVVWLAAEPDLAGVTGGYFADRKLVATSKAARDDALAARLWEESERLVGLGPAE